MIPSGLGMKLAEASPRGSCLAEAGSSQKELRDLRKYQKGRLPGPFCCGPKSASSISELKFWHLECRTAGWLIWQPPPPPQLLHSLILLMVFTSFLPSGPWNTKSRRVDPRFKLSAPAFIYHPKHGRSRTHLGTC